MLNLTEILARGEVATPGPWHEKHSMVWPSSTMFGDDQVADCSCSNREQANLDFIVHSRRDLPACAALLRRICQVLSIDESAVYEDDVVGMIEVTIELANELDRELQAARQRIKELEVEISQLKERLR